METSRDGEEAYQTSRVTKETSIEATMSLGQPTGRLAVGLPFFEHLLHAFSFHGRLGLSIQGTGDIDVDPHHLVEDVGIVVGHLVAQASQAQPRRRFGHEVIPMDDALAEATVDLGGRSYLVYRADLPQPYAGTFDLSLLREYWHGFVGSAGCNLHLMTRYGENSHHLMEASFKAAGRALSLALVPATDVISTKGYIEPHRNV